MAAVRFTIAQNERKSISNPARITAIGGDNPTEFYINLPHFPPGSQWVFPFVYGFMYVVDVPSYQPVTVDASQIPPGASSVPTTSKVALLAAYDADDMSFNAGNASTGSTLTRWNINSAPGVGVKATVTRAASPGVTHVADFADLKQINSTSAAIIQRRFSIIDGVSGGVTFLFTTFLSTPVTVGTQDGENIGPGLNLRGTPGTAMTIEAAAADVGIIQTVNLSGFDQ